MADRLVRQRVDDFDGTSEADHRIIFSIDNRWYRIDVTTENRQRLIDAMAPFIAVAEKLPSLGRSRLLTATDKEIRDWARANGEKVSDRGRVGQDVVAKYYAAH